ncbi:hypothetical protein D1013_18950 [Euzebyella marina]|uniref:DUF4136 domain-containing protein n=1 Tax=Euzebyella marina TaxID=1761453 RepID=A0A3G2LAM4_9FLAO|nr:hypothetical protein [Euzebyella marina]AYN69316.1 hypothetical protein D1013_18950 [Euzebyella marina]
MKKFVLLMALTITGLATAQKLKIEEGDFDFLPGQQEVNVEFVYDNMKLLKKNLPEEQYVAEHAAEMEEKSPGKGDTWKKKWEAAPELIWQPKFLELMNRYFYDDHQLAFKEGLADAKYTLIVETVWLYPGWDAGVMKQPAKVTTNLKFVETADPSNVLAEVSSENAPGDQWGSSFSNEDRLGEGYAKTGKSFARLVLKKTKAF